MDFLAGDGIGGAVGGCGVECSVGWMDGWIGLDWNATGRMRALMLCLALIYLVLEEYGSEAMEIEMAMQRDTMPSLQTMTPSAMLVCKQKMILK